METGQTALIGASGSVHLKIVKGLLAGGANKDKAIDGGATPLFMAAHNGHIAVVEALLKVGADKSKATIFGHTALYMATKQGRTDITALLAGGEDSGEHISSCVGKWEPGSEQLAHHRERGAAFC